MAPVSAAGRWEGLAPVSAAAGRWKGLAPVSAAESTAGSTGRPLGYSRFEDGKRAACQDPNDHRDHTAPHHAASPIRRSGRVLVLLRVHRDLL